MGKRTSGDGGFFHDVKCEIWIYRLRYTDADGNRGRKKIAAKTKCEAMLNGKGIIDSLNRAATDDEKLTVGNRIRNWLENYAKPNVRPRTYEKYSGTLKAYILPTFENVLLNELTAADLQKHLNRLLETGQAYGTGLSSSTVRGTRRYLSMCIDDAVKSGLVSSNVVRLTKAPKLSKKEIAVLSKDEIARLINAAKEIEHPFMSVVMPQIISLTVYTVMHQGEVFGLKWEDVDFEKSCLFIRRSLPQVIGKGTVFQAPNTKNSVRRILLMSEDVKNLRAYKKWQENKKIIPKSLAICFRVTISFSPVRSANR